MTGLAEKKDPPDSDQNLESFFQGEFLGFHEYRLREEKKKGCVGGREKDQLK